MKIHSAKVVQHKNRNTRQVCVAPARLRIPAIHVLEHCQCSSAKAYTSLEELFFILYDFTVQRNITHASQSTALAQHNIQLAL